MKKKMRKKKKGSDVKANIRDPINTYILNRDDKS